MWWVGIFNDSGYLALASPVLFCTLSIIEMTKEFIIRVININVFLNYIILLSKNKHPPSTHPHLLNTE